MKINETLKVLRRTGLEPIRERKVLRESEDTGTWKFEVDFDPPIGYPMKWAVSHGLEVRFEEGYLLTLTGPADVVAQWTRNFYDSGETVEEMLEFYYSDESGRPDDVTCRFEVDFEPKKVPDHSSITWALARGIAIRASDDLYLTGPKEKIVTWIKKFYNTGEAPEAVLSYAQEK